MKREEEQEKEGTKLKPTQEKKGGRNPEVSGE